MSVNTTKVLPGEAEDILEEIESVIPDSKRWVNSPNELFGWRKPRDLIGTTGFFHESDRL